MAARIVRKQEEPDESNIKTNNLPPYQPRRARDIELELVKLSLEGPS